MARLTLTLLGGLAASVDGVPVTRFDADKTRALLAYLAAEAARPHAREAVAGLLWPELPEEASRRNLRHSLFKLRQILDEGAASPASQGFLLVTPQTVQIDPAADCSLDVVEFTALVAASRGHRHRKVEYCTSCHSRLQSAAELYRGDFLKGFHLADSQEFEEWLVLKREALHREALDLFDHLATYHETHGEYEQALRYAYKQLQLEGWREEAHRQAMRLLALTGQRCAALAQYETCRRVLADELDAEPSADTTALYERLKAGETADDTIVRMGPATRHNLPRQLTPFIGRKVELARITERLDSPDYGLITLMGAGGVGKTRLALQAASGQVGVFDNGVYWVPLASISSPDLITSSIAQVTGCHFEASEDPRSQLLHYLRDKEMLLLLDNFEHLLAGAEATDLLLSILSDAPGISMLVTSRERLGLQAEYLVDLSGLPVPDWDDDLESYDSVQLFVERAQQANPEFALSDATAQGALDICRLVAGLPLGIVLAAAWVRHLSPARIASSIRANLDFLSSTTRDAAPQHSSLRAVFDHSWALLSQEEQGVFRRLSVFRGGWDEEAAEGVAGASLPVLLSLVDKSLLRRATIERFDLHEVLRQYAAEKLQEVPEEQAAVQQDHAYFFLKLAELAQSGLLSDQQDRWLTYLEREHDNLRAVLRWAQENAQAEVGLRLGVALTRFWFIRGYYGEGRAALEAVLSLPPPSLDPSQPDELRSLKRYRARALGAAGDLARPQGDYPAARSLCEESLALYRELGDRKEIAIGLNQLAALPWNQGDLAEARALLEESLALWRELGDRAHVGSTLANLAVLAFVEGDYTSARALLEEGVVLSREAGNKFSTAIQLNSLGNVALMQGEYAAARAWHFEALALRRELGDKWGIAISLIGLGGAAIGAGASEKGTRLLGAAEALLDAIGVTLEQDDRIPYEHGVAAARARLDEASFEAAWAEGKALSPDQAIAYALEDG